jgi:hypothetical protein
VSKPFSQVDGVLYRHRCEDDGRLEIAPQQGKQLVGCLWGLNNRLQDLRETVTEADHETGNGFSLTTPDDTHLMFLAEEHLFFGNTVQYFYLPAFTEAISLASTFPGVTTEQDAKANLWQADLGKTGRNRRERWVLLDQRDLLHQKTGEQFSDRVVFDVERGIKSVCDPIAEVF